MTILLVQTFLLLLGAFLLGASLACLLRRGLSPERKAEVDNTSVATAAPPTAPVAGTDRFGRALSGGAGPAVPPVFQPGQPVVEVQPRPDPEPQFEPVPEPVASVPPEPAPAPAPAPQVAAPPPSPPQRDVLPPRPAPDPAPVRSDEQSYTQIAVAAAAAAALAARARAEAEATAAASAPDPEVEELAAEEDAETRFGTPATTSPLERLPSEPVDDLTRIHGIDIELKERLVRYGVHRFSQIAAWTPDDVRGVNQTLGFQDRVEKENWVEQARILAEGGDPGRARAAKPPAAVELSAVDGDRLHRIIGIDPQSEALLRANGVTALAQIATWSADDVARFEALLGTAGRIEREGWVSQAVFLTGGAPPAPEPEPVEAARPTIVFEVPEPAEAPSVAPTGDSYSGLRSVRSEALIGDTARFVPSGDIHDLKRIRGIGVLIEKKLNSLGITSYEQVANWTRADIDKISDVLDFKGRIERENWIEQARILASGGQTEFSRRVDRGDA